MFGMSFRFLLRDFGSFSSHGIMLIRPLLCILRDALFDLPCWFLFCFIVKSVYKLCHWIFPSFAKLGDFHFVSLWVLLRHKGSLYCDWFF